MTSDDDQSLDDDGAAAGGEESEVRSAASEDASDPPSRPPSHAPWMYPSDIRIDPSSLETSPKAERAAAAADAEPVSKQQQQQQLPSVGQSPSPAPAQSRLKHLRQQRAPPDTATVAGEPTASEVESELDFEDEGRLCDRLNLPHGVTGVEGRVFPFILHTFLYSLSQHDSVRKWS